MADITNRSMTLLLNDIIGGGFGNTSVTITEMSDGTLRFDISSPNGDLRGFALDFLNETLLKGMTATTLDGTMTAQLWGDDSLKTAAAKDVNFTGDVVNATGGLDAIMTFGTAGASKDYITSASFLLQSASGPMTLDTLAGAWLATRVTSLTTYNADGSIATTGDSSKDAEHIGMNLFDAVKDTLAVDEDATGSINVLANDLAATGATVTQWYLDGVAIKGDTYTDAATGTIFTFNSNGTVTVDATDADILHKGEQAVFNFSYDAKAADGADSTTVVRDHADLQIVINGLDNDNAAPVATDVALEVMETGHITILQSDLATDADGDALTFFINGQEMKIGDSITLASGAVLTMMDDGNFDLTPAGTSNYLWAGETAQDSFQFQVSDGKVMSDTATANVTIVGERTDVVASADTITTGANFYGAINVYSNDYAFNQAQGGDHDMADIFSTAFFSNGLVNGLIAAAGDGLSYSTALAASFIQNGFTTIGTLGSASSGIDANGNLSASSDVLDRAQIDGAVSASANLSASATTGDDGLGTATLSSSNAVVADFLQQMMYTTGGDSHYGTTDKAAGGAVGSIGGANALTSANVGVAGDGVTEVIGANTQISAGLRGAAENFGSASIDAGNGALATQVTDFSMLNAGLAQALTSLNASAFVEATSAGLLFGATANSTAYGGEDAWFIANVKVDGIPFIDLNADGGHLTMDDLMNHNSMIFMTQAGAIVAANFDTGTVEVNNPEIVAALGFDLATIEQNMLHWMLSQGYQAGDTVSDHSAFNYSFLDSLYGESHTADINIEYVVPSFADGIITAQANMFDAQLEGFGSDLGTGVTALASENIGASGGDVSLQAGSEALNAGVSNVNATAMVRDGVQADASANVQTASQAQASADSASSTMTMQMNMSQTDSESNANLMDNASINVNGGANATAVAANNVNAGADSNVAAFSAADATARNEVTGSIMQQNNVEAGGGSDVSASNDAVINLNGSAGASAQAINSVATTDGANADASAIASATADNTVAATINQENDISADGSSANVSNEAAINLSNTTLVTSSAVNNAAALDGANVSMFNMSVASEQDGAAASINSQNSLNLSDGSAADISTSQTINADGGVNALGTQGYAQVSASGADSSAQTFMTQDNEIQNTGAGAAANSVVDGYAADNSYAATDTTQNINLNGGNNGAALDSATQFAAIDNSNAAANTTQNLDLNGANNSAALGSTTQLAAIGDSNAVAGAEQNIYAGGSFNSINASDNLSGMATGDSAAMLSGSQNIAADGYFGSISAGNEVLASAADDASAVAYGEQNVGVGGEFNNTSASDSVQSAATEGSAAFATAGQSVNTTAGNFINTSASEGVQASADGNSSASADGSQNFAAYDGGFNNIAGDDSVSANATSGGSALASGAQDVSANGDFSNISVSGLTNAASADGGDASAQSSDSLSAATGVIASVNTATDANALSGSASAQSGNEIAAIGGAIASVNTATDANAFYGSASAQSDNAVDAISGSIAFINTATDANTLSGSVSAQSGNEITADGGSVAYVNTATDANALYGSASALSNNAIAVDESSMTSLDSATTASANSGSASAESNDLVNVNDASVALVNSETSAAATASPESDGGSGSASAQSYNNDVADSSSDLYVNTATDANASAGDATAQTTSDAGAYNSSIASTDIQTEADAANGSAATALTQGYTLADGSSIANSDASTLAAANNGSSATALDAASAVASEGSAVNTSNDALATANDYSSALALDVNFASATSGSIASTDTGAAAAADGSGASSQAMTIDYATASNESVVSQSVASDAGASSAAGLNVTSDTMAVEFTPGGDATAFGIVSTNEQSSATASATSQGNATADNGSTISSDISSAAYAASSAQDAITQQDLAGSAQGDALATSSASADTVSSASAAATASGILYAADGSVINADIAAQSFAASSADTATDQNSLALGGGSDSLATAGNDATAGATSSASADASVQDSITASDATTINANDSALAAVSSDATTTINQSNTSYALDGGLADGLNSADGTANSAATASANVNESLAAGLGISEVDSSNQAIAVASNCAETTIDQSASTLASGSGADAEVSNFTQVDSTGMDGTAAASTGGADASTGSVSETTEAMAFALDGTYANAQSMTMSSTETNTDTGIDTLNGFALAAADGCTTTDASSSGESVSVVDTSVNNPPTADDTTFQAQDLAAQQFDLTPFASDPDGDKLAFSAADGTASELSLAGANVSFSADGAATYDDSGFLAQMLHAIDQLFVTGYSKGIYPIYDYGTFFVTLNDYKGVDDLMTQGLNTVLSQMHLEGYTVSGLNGQDNTFDANFDLHATTTDGFDYMVNDNRSGTDLGHVDIVTDFSDGTMQVLEDALAAHFQGIINTAS